MKQRIIVTDGGEFREGSNVIRKLRELNKYFASSLAVQRRHALTEVQKSHGSQELGGIIDVDVRVASVVNFFQRSIVNYTAFEWYFKNGKDGKKEEAIFTCISENEWSLIVEMEAIMHRVAELVLVESQAANTLSSTMFVLLRVASARMNTYTFAAYQLNSLRYKDTNEKNFPCIELQFDKISELGHPCITRTLPQIATRLPRPLVTNWHVLERRHLDVESERVAVA
ncbi:hypothetical protein ON010_g4721 [Phytophthora cinnamomi]|nr:hypothetical protein ON010_g4721 [Phytophthora cinnamomi]